MKKSGVRKIVKIEFEDQQTGECVPVCDSSRKTKLTTREEPVDGACGSRSNEKGLCYIIDGLESNKPNAPARTFKTTFEMFNLDVIGFDIPSLENSLRQKWDGSNGYNGFIGIILLNETNANYKADKHIIDKLLENKFWTEKPKIFIVFKPSDDKEPIPKLASDGKKNTPLHIRKYQFDFDNSKMEGAEHFAATICDSLRNNGSSKSIQKILNYVADQINEDGQCVPVIGGTMNDEDEYILKSR